MKKMLQLRDATPLLGMKGVTGIMHLRWYGWRIIKNAERIIFISNAYKERFVMDYVPDSIKDVFYPKL